MATRRRSPAKRSAEWLRSSHPIARSLQEYGRGIAGGLLFSLPLLYTMEVWWAGFVMTPARQLCYVAVTFLLLLGYNRYAGLRHDSSWLEVVIDSVEELGLGLVIAAAAMYALGRIEPDQSTTENVARVIVEAMTVAIGVSVGTAQLGNAEPGEAGMGPEGGKESGKAGPDRPTFGGQLVLGVCGAVLFAANIAPTDEIVALAVEAPAERLILLAVISLGLAALVLFFSDFRSARRRASAEGTLAVTRAVVITYAVGLASSAGILWLFGRFDDAAPVVIVGQTVVLGVGATLGASAGRMLLQQAS